MIETVITCLAIASLPLAFWAGHEWGKRRYRVPVRSEGHTDEYLILKGEQYVPYDPPKYVPQGMSPVAAGWEMTRKTRIQHHTRRVE